MKQLLLGRYFLRVVLRRIGSLEPTDGKALVADCYNIHVYTRVWND